MKRLSLSALALIAIAGAARSSIVRTASASQAHSVSAAVTDPEQQVEAIEKEFEDAQKEVLAKIKDLATDEDRSKYYAEHIPDPKKFVVRFVAVADANPKTEAAARALAWVVTLMPNDPAARTAFERLANDHGTSSWLTIACSSLEGIQGAWIDAALEHLIDASPTAAVRAQALFTLARRATSPEYSGSKRTPAQAAELYERLIRDYADAGGGKLKERAEHELFELRSLVFGKVAPDIEGADFDGKAFKLTDYGGKVVVLDFWGNW